MTKLTSELQNKVSQVYSSAVKQPTYWPAAVTYFREVFQNYDDPFLGWIIISAELDKIYKVSPRQTTDIPKSTMEIILKVAESPVSAFFLECLW